MSESRNKLDYSKTIGIMLFILLVAAPISYMLRPASAQSDEVNTTATNTRFLLLEEPSPTYDKLDIYVQRSTDNGDSWEDPVNLSSNSGNSFRSEILVSGSKVYVVWVQESSDGTKSDVYFRGSVNDGESWGSKIKLSSTGTSFDSSVLVGASGSNVYVVWDDSGTGDVYVRRSTNNGGTWASIVNLSGNPGKSDTQDLSVTGSNVYVVWAQANSGGSATDVFVRVSNDDGASWESKKKLSSSGKAVEPTVASSGSRAHVAWQDTSEGNGDIFLKKSANEGADWGSARNMSTDSARSSLPELATSGTSVYLEYTKRTSTRDYSIIFRSSSNSGDTWGGKTTLATTHPYGIGPATILTAGNYVHVVIELVDKDNVFLTMRSSANNGASFGPSVDPSSEDFVGATDMVVSGSDLFAVWVGFVHGERIAFAKSTDNGSTWSVPEILDPDASRARIA
jgi:hypothetical protein